MSSSCFECIEESTVRIFLKFLLNRTTLHKKVYWILNAGSLLKFSDLYSLWKFMGILGNLRNFIEVKRCLFGGYGRLKFHGSLLKSTVSWRFMEVC